MRTETKDNGVDSAGSTTCPDEINTLDRPQVALVRQAIEITRTPMKVVSISLRVDPAYLSRMFSGEKPFPIEKLSDLPDDVRRQHARLMAEREGWEVRPENRRRRVLKVLLNELLEMEDALGDQPRCA